MGRISPVAGMRPAFPEPEHARGPARRRPRATIPGGQGLVLVVEDERAIADLISLYLRRDDFGGHADGGRARGAVALHAEHERSRPVGTGVGLALVTRLGGTIEAGPAPEGGAAFTVRLPDA